MHRKLINIDYQLTKHPALTGTRKALEACQEGTIQVAKHPSWGVLCLGKLMLFSFSLQLLCDEVLGSFLCCFMKAKSSGNSQAQQEHGRGWMESCPSLCPPAWGHHIPSGSS